MLRGQPLGGASSLLCTPVNEPHDTGPPDTAGGVEWPLVERREPTARTDATPVVTADADDSVTTALWPFRLLALVGAVVLGRHDLADTDWQLIAALVTAAAYAAVVILRPIPAHDDPRVRLRVVVEVSVHTVLVMLTGAWDSPLALCLIPTAMIAGFAAGSAFAVQVMVPSVIVVSVQHLPGGPAATQVQDAALWAGLLGVVTFTSGLSQRAAANAARQKAAVLQRVNRLTEANSLLFALQRVAQSMPASLDLDDIADSTLQRVKSLVPADSVSLYLMNETDRQLELFRNLGSAATPTISIDEAPPMIRSAMQAPRTLRLARFGPGAGMSPVAQSGIYSALRARGAMVGLLAVEAHSPDAHTQQHSEIVHGLAEPFGVAIDNARLFRQIRSASANEERGRIARDLHDQVGSSLAFLGFEVDRAQELAARGEPVEPVLIELRSHLTTVINDIRETLHDLRTDVTDDRDLPATLRAHLDRVRDRRALETRLTVDAAERPPRQVERELWQMALEAITNAEKHARASTLDVGYTARDGRVVLRVSDDGIGLNHGELRADRYGMIGMRERAEGIGATLRVDSPDSGGTTITVVLDQTGTER